MCAQKIELVNTLAADPTLLKTAHLLIAFSNVRNIFIYRAQKRDSLA
jgi:hypothetical protein